MRRTAENRLVGAVAVTPKTAVRIRTMTVSLSTAAQLRRKVVAPLRRCGVMLCRMKARNVERTVPVIAVDLPGHGTFSATAPGLDLAMEQYHGCTARELAALVTERVGIDFHDVEARSSLLIVLAELDGHAGDLAPRVRAQVVQTGLFA